MSAYLSRAEMEARIVAGESVLYDNRVISRVEDLPDEIDLSLITTPARFPENEEVVALATQQDTAGGRTSDVLTNKYGRGVQILLDVTEVSGEAAVEQIYVEARMGGIFVQVAKLWGDASAPEIKPYLFVIYPTASEIGELNINGPLAGEYRIRVVTTTDSEGSDITYSVHCVHVL